MAPFSSKNKSKRPKFLFNLQINELVNIPQSTGNCYVKWHFKEGTGTSGTTPLSSETGDGQQHIQTSIQNKGYTSHLPIKHHRVQWNYTLNKPIQIKLQVDRNRNLVPKCISFEVYLENVLTHNKTFPQATDPASPYSSSPVNIPLSPALSHRSSLLRSPSLRSPTNSFDLSRKDTIAHSTTNNISKSVGKIFLGKIDVNVAEYIKPNEQPISNRFLLKDSKINSILNVTFQLKIIRGSYDDFNLSNQFTMGQLSSPFQNGLSNLIDNSISSDINNTSSSTNTSTFKSSRPLLSHSTQPSMNSNSYSSRSNGLSTISNSLNPLIESLYEKTFQLSWDERPNEFTPRECIEDILRGGNGWAKNENGINLIDLQALRLKNIEANYYSDDNDNNYMARRKMSVVSNEDEKYWNNMDNKEFLERKHQQISNQTKPKSSLSTNNGLSHTSSVNGAISNSINGTAPFDAIIRDAKSWTVKQANI